MGTQSVFFPTLGSVLWNVIRFTVGFVIWSLVFMVAIFTLLAGAVCCNGG